MVHVRETAAVRLSRLLALVPWLEQHPGVSIGEAARHFGVTPDELEQDLWLTICCGLPGHGPDQLIDIQFWAEDDSIDVEGSIRVIDAQTLARPLGFSPAEAMSLLVGLRLLAQVPGDHDRAALASATAKLESAADIAQGAAVVVDDPQEELARRLADAIVQARAVRLVYAGGSSDEVSERVVEPAHILSHGGSTYLGAWCREAGAQRTFRLDRIRSCEVLEDPVGPHPVPSSIAPVEGTLARLRVAPQSRWLLETLDPQEIVEFDDRSCEATLVVAQPPWLIRMVLGQAGGVEVLGPPGLRRQVHDAALEALGRMPADPS